MDCIDRRFKDCAPEETVKRIQAALKQLGIELREHWNPSGISGCWSLIVTAQEGYPFFTNGKGVTQNLARASAYGEFIERLQCGLFLYKFQSIDRTVDFHSHAPDGKFMTLSELEEQGEWMDWVIAGYGGGLTRKKLARLCADYACAEDGKVWTVPFYSLFEDKYIYLPAAYVERVCATNGCCAGNTRQEAWIHGLSEMLERHCAVTRLLSGKAPARLPEETLRRFPVAMHILEQLRRREDLDITIFDLSTGNGFPVVATRIINRRTHGYKVNIAADPVLEIAVHRTLTEILQGRNVEGLGSRNDGRILSSAEQFPLSGNIQNQLETGSGLFTVDFFADELTCRESCARFEDRSDWDNSRILEDMLKLYRDMGRPVYVRNQSFLGFPSYHFVVPGFSELKGYLLTEPVSEYAMGDQAAKVFCNPMEADASALALLLIYHNKIKHIHTRRDSFSLLSGIPFQGSCDRHLTYITLSYAAWRLKRYTQAIEYLNTLLKQPDLPAEDADWFSCLRQWMDLTAQDVPQDKLRCALTKFYAKHTVEPMFALLDSGGSPYDGYLLRCDRKSCESCRYQPQCRYHTTAQIIARAGQAYESFTDGQNRAHFTD